MTKSEYMQALQEKMEKFNRELQMEIVEDYEQHFAEGLAAGRTEDEIIEELGNIEDMISELPEKDIKQEISIPQSADNEKSADSQKYNAVVIDGLVADVHVQNSADGKITMEYHNEGDDAQKKLYRFYQYEENGVFHLGVKRNDNAAYTRQAKRAVKIMLFGRSYEINVSSSGDSLDRDISLTVGIPEGMSRVEASTGSGDIDFDGDFEEYIVRTGSGDVEMRVGSRARAVLVETGSGDMDIDLGRVKDPSIKAHTGSGECHVYGADGTRRKVSSRYTVGNGECKVEINTGSGDAEVRCY